MALAQLYTCPACDRRYAVVGDTGEPPMRCACGNDLEEESPPSGVYEMFRRRDPEATGVAREPDLGYGESHGYGPAHGGPTSPGDAPGPAPSSRRLTGND